MAPGVLKTFRRHLTDMTLFLCGVRGGVTLERAELKALVAEHVPTIEPCETAVGRLFAALRQSGVEVADEDIRRIWRQAYDTTRRETHQAMEGFIHNLNTMHSRGGNQVVFSSVNYGTDFSPEGRMVIRELLSATIEGLGHGEVPVFPIQIFKVKEGVSWSGRGLCRSGEATSTRHWPGRSSSKTPNFDLLIEACRTTSVALFPQLHVSRRTVQPPREVAHRRPRPLPLRGGDDGVPYARVRESARRKVVGGAATSLHVDEPAAAGHRGDARGRDMIPDGNKHAIRKAREIFLESVRKTATMMAEQLYERYCPAHGPRAAVPVYDVERCWKGGGRLQPNDEVGDVLKHGTLGIGFIGRTQRDGGDLRRRPCDLEGGVADALRRRDGDEPRGRAEAKNRLNYFRCWRPRPRVERTLHAHGPQALRGNSGRHRPRLHVNSFHVDVRRPVSIVEKIRLEAPFHAITRGGTSPTSNSDGEARKNSRGDPQDRQGDAGRGIGYGSINHPIDTCRKWATAGDLPKCPVCEFRTTSCACAASRVT